MNEDDRKVALEGIKHIIKTNKAPNRKGQATEKTLSTKETTGLKELVRIMQDNQSDEFIFDFLGWFFYLKVLAFLDLNFGPKHADVLLVQIFLLFYD